MEMIKDKEKLEDIIPMEEKELFGKAQISEAQVPIIKKGFEPTSNYSTIISEIKRMLKFEQKDEVKEKRSIKDDPGYNYKLVGIALTKAILTAIKGLSKQDRSAFLSGIKTVLKDTRWWTGN